METRYRIGYERVGLFGKKPVVILQVLKQIPTDYIQRMDNYWQYVDATFEDIQTMMLSGDNNE